MKYLCLAYYDPQQFDALDPAERDAIVAACHKQDAELHKTGRLVLVGSLGEPGVSASIRPRNGVPMVTDGPYIETKEQIGAFFIIEANDQAEAVAIASKHPSALLTFGDAGGIEVRPCDHFDQH